MKKQDNFKSEKNVDEDDKKEIKHNFLPDPKLLEDEKKIVNLDLESESNTDSSEEGGSKSGFN